MATIPIPAELLDTLIDAGNKALNDHYHGELCNCRKWPESCASSGRYFFGAWDTDAFTIALPTILAAYEVAKRADRQSPADTAAAVVHDEQPHQP